jgi:dephospho-CoA kinase
MVKADKKPIIGILGGMCSGKSTVAAEFGKLGCAVIDADQISHQMLDDKSVRAKITRVFGREILDDKGKISRPELANMVFGDPGKLTKLTGIIHPLVLAEVEQLTARYKEEPAVKAIILDIPLLMEVGWEKKCDFLIFVDCKPPLRLERARKTGVFDADKLKVRENLQISLDNKKHIADNIIDNNSDLSGLSKQIAGIFTSILGRK